MIDLSDSFPKAAFFACSSFVANLLDCAPKKSAYDAENSDKMFEAAFMAAIDAGVENPYEEAATASTTSM